jgi:putative transposase
MPWKERRTMSLKIEFVERAGAGEKVAALCREYGISRTSGHKWINRFKQSGYEGLEEESRRPRTTPLATAEEVVLATIRARDAHPHWGARKLYRLLHRRFGDDTPRERTIGRILRRADKIRTRRPRLALSVIEHAPKLKAAAPNDVWTVDHKGWWYVLDGSRCQPLTVRDAFSRFVLATAAGATTCVAARSVFEQLFQRYGVPNVIQCDNGPPFVSVRVRGGFTSLSAWWVTLGIRIVRSRPGCPQDNGGHERMHRDVCAEVQSNPAETVEEQQHQLDRWRQEFNRVRPHDALKGKTPAEVYKVIERRRPRVQAYAYPEHFFQRRVGGGGLFQFRKDGCYLGEAFAGLEVGIEVVDEFRVRAWLRDIDLGLVDTLPSADEAYFTVGRDPPKPQIGERPKRGGTRKETVPSAAGESVPHR